MYAVHGQFKRPFRTRRVEEDRLIGGAVLLQDVHVVGIEHQAVLVVLDVRGLEREAQARDLLELVVGERELEVIPLAELAKLFDLVMVAGNERAEFAASHAEVVARGFERLLGAVNVRACR